MCKKAFNWCCKNGIFVYVQPISGSDGKNRPDAQLRVRTPNGTRYPDTIYKQNEDGLIEMASKAKEIYEAYYKLNNK